MLTLWYHMFYIISFFTTVGHGGSISTYIDYVINLHDYNIKFHNLDVSCVLERY